MGRGARAPTPPRPASGGLCAIDSCDAGYADCDANGANRCETDPSTTTDCETDPSTATDCGVCGHACGAGGTCNAGVCSARLPQVAAGATHTCEVLDSGAVACWGDNASGQLGDGTTGVLRSTVPVAVLGISDATFAAAGFYSSCAVRTNGRVACWGDNGRGQLGIGTTGGQSAVPVEVIGVAGAARVAVGDGHACAVRADGKVACWGNNASGQLGDGTTTSHANATLAGTLGQAYEVFGDGFSCALDVLGRAFCWGANDRGQLGDGAGGAPSARSTSPVRVARFSAPSSRSALADITLLAQGGTRSTRAWACAPITACSAGAGTRSGSSRPATPGTASWPSRTGPSTSRAPPPAAATRASATPRGTWRARARATAGSSETAPARARASSPSPSRARGCSERAAATPARPGPAAGRAGGRTSRGPLGDGSLVDRSSPVNVSGLP